MGVAKTPTKKGTTVTNKYQKTMPKTSTEPGLAVPDAVSISMIEIAEDMREDLLAGDVNSHDVESSAKRAPSQTWALAVKQPRSDCAASASSPWLRRVRKALRNSR